MQKKASDRLFNLDAYLEVSKTSDGLIKVKYQGAYIIDDGAEVSAAGYGLDFDEACEKYLDKISGEKLRIYDPFTNDKTEVTVL